MMLGSRGGEAVMSLTANHRRPRRAARRSGNVLPRASLPEQSIPPRASPWERAVAGCWRMFGGKRGSPPIRDVPEERCLASPNPTSAVSGIPSLQCCRKGRGVRWCVELLRSPVPHRAPPPQLHHIDVLGLQGALKAQPVFFFFPPCAGCAGAFSLLLLPSQRRELPFCRG